MRQAALPQGHDLSAFLNTLAAEPYSMQRSESVPLALSWAEALPLIRNLADREDQIVLDAAIADLDFKQDRRWLEEHPDELSEEELRTIVYLRQCGAGEKALCAMPHCRKGAES